MRTLLADSALLSLINSLRVNAQLVNFQLIG